MKTARQRKHTHPFAETFNGTSVSFRMMTAEDESMVLKFANTLPEEDLIFLRMDITQPEVVSEWVRNIESGRTITIIAEEDGRMVGYASLHSSHLHWTRHIGEVRMLVNSKMRGLGVGRSMVNQIIKIAAEKKLERVIVQISSNQPRVRKMFEDLNFEPQALLTDWLKDRNNRTHDLIIMSENIED